VGIPSFTLLNSLLSNIFPTIYETRNQIAVQWVSAPSTIRPFKELIVCRLLRDNEQLWYKVVSSEGILYTPLDLRSWMLSFGAKLRPDILVPTLERYYANLNGKLGSSRKPITELQRIKGKEEAGTLSVKESPQPKKRTKIRIQGNSLVTKDPRYNQAVQAMRDFLVQGNEKASFLRNAPAALRDREAINHQMAAYWLPTIKYYWGNISTFLFYFSKAEDGNQALQHLVESGAVDDVVKSQLDRFLAPAVANWRNRLQQEIDKKALPVYKGTQLSAHNVAYLNLVLNFETKKDAAARVLAKGVSSQPLPCVLREAPEVVQQVKAVVQSRKGGWQIHSWSDPEFVSAVINHKDNATTQSETQYTVAQQFLNEKCKITYVGTWLIKLYLKSLEPAVKDDLLHRVKIENEQLTAKMQQLNGDYKQTKRKELWDSFVALDEFSSD
jgi:hypothetical protein